MLIRISTAIQDASEAVPPQELQMTIAERLAVRQLLAAFTVEGLAHSRNDLRDQFVT